MKNLGSCDKILIRGVNWVGDAVMTMPAVRSIRDNYPEAQLSLLVKPWVKDLFLNDPSLNDLLPYRNDYKGIFGKFRAGSEIRKEDFQCSYLFQNAFDAAIISFLAGIPERIGYGRDGRGLFLTRPAKITKEILDLHHIRYYLHLLETVGLTAHYRLPWIYPDLEQRLKARSILQNLKRPVIGLNPGAAYGSAKRWPPERFGRVATRIIDELGGSVVIFGSANESAMGAGIMSSIPEEVLSDNSFIDLTGKTSLSGLCDLLSECDLLITNDSGPMHIGYAVGTPLIGIFGSTSPEHTGPPEYRFEGAEFGYRFRIIRGEAECAPCFERTCRYGHLACMESIPADTVFTALKELLPSRKAIFFDRDGTLCRDAHYLNKMDDLEIFPDVHKLHALKDKDYLLIGVTNQSGISRGIVQEDFVREVNGIFQNKFGFDSFYYCPHHPDDRCACRKPFHGMLLKARADLGIDLRRSYMVGDSERDIIAGKLAGATTIMSGDDNISERYADHLIRSIRDLSAVL